MSTKNFFIGGIVGGVVFFFLGYLLYGNLLADFFNKNAGLAQVPMAEYKWWALILGNLFSGFFLSYILVKSGSLSVSSGLITGAIIGFLASGSADLVLFATTKILGKSSLIVDVVTVTVMSAIAGAIIAAVINMLNKSRATVTETVV